MRKQGFAVAPGTHTSIIVKRTQVLTFFAENSMFLNHIEFLLLISKMTITVYMLSRPFINHHHMDSVKRILWLFHNVNCSVSPKQSLMNVDALISSWTQDSMKEVRSSCVSCSMCFLKNVKCVSIQLLCVVSFLSLQHKWVILLWATNQRYLDLFIVC